ncbi:hypothetical protein BASA50_004884 [Batrachochytrium salamandrivorans]|uniref:Brl1/Brr6 domain-containing protein n=1 Tax=Batrachochytrium salamandrivorans TaxID=1357716 RepID=A0ABQ8FE90_9FUNG|nr:hypothetical protein BASA62_002711 [Batrachochytrium salamandrivorans]KAH6582967.1 hypothetical protein BASA60_001673 [Batrachochytrium salamandrivorans]KAH6584719.1 hypothetical protein BASA61_007288 [Batrachochytrium salamandrivorans]KAH6596816.1 hypothetical protein BASA50_004884 [Batrachochytrium salamandrivorans]KAH9263426.1 hypothetical protein BASA83_013182 [Batrachochytrium salamandrivorans]
MATNAHSPVSDLSPSGRRTKGQEWPSTRIRPSSLQASRGTESPMDFEMASDLAPDERSPWLLAVAMLTTPTKKKQLNQSPFQSPLPPSHSALSTVHPTTFSKPATRGGLGAASYIQPISAPFLPSQFGSTSFGQTRAGDLFSSTGISSTKDIFQFGMSSPTQKQQQQQQQQQHYQSHLHRKQSPIKKQPISSISQSLIKTAKPHDGALPPHRIKTFEIPANGFSPKKCDPMILDNRDIKPRGRKRKKTGEPLLSNENSVDNHSEYNSKSISPVRGPSYHYMHLPYLITGYIQVAFTFFIVCIVAYILVQLIASVRHDLQMKADEFSQEMTQQIAMCTKSYYENRCMPGQRVPAVYKVCNEWEACMSRDPRDVGRLKVGAETLAEILNKLVDPLSYKTMIFGALTLFGTLLFTSSAFSFVRRRSADPSATEIHHHHHPIQHQYTPPGHKTNAYSMALATNDSTNYLGMDQLRLRSGSTSRRHDRII